MEGTMSAPRDVPVADQLCPSDCWVQDLVTFDPPQDENLYSRDRYQPRPSAVYVPLKPWQIRLLRLEPGAADDGITMRLHTATLLLHAGVLLDETAENVTYEALSYSWGYGQEERAIQCNHIEMLVSLKVHTALRHLRHPDRHRFLWIDAICINQSDLHEKGEQVQRMFSIYFKAERVIVWLGSAAGLDAQAIAWINHCSRKIRHRQQCEPGLAQIRKSIERLCNHPWWRRVWIRQEAFAASDLVIHVEGASIAFDEFKTKYWQAYASTVEELGAFHEAQSPNLIDTLSIPSLVNRGDQVHAGFLAHQRDTATVTTNPALSLDAVLRGSCDHRATDPRDYIYGVISMTTIKTRAPGHSIPQDRFQSLRLDYGLSFEEVFSDVTYNFINSHQCLDVIYLAQETRAADSALPTWCPDWTKLKQDVSLDVVWALQDIDAEYILEWGTTDEAHMAVGDKTYERSRLGVESQLYLPNRAAKDILASSRINTTSTSHNSRVLHCSGTLLGVLSAVRKDYHYQDKQHRWGDDPVWAVRWWLQDNYDFREAMIIPIESQGYEFVPSRWSHCSDPIDHDHCDPVDHTASRECKDVRATIRSTSELRALVMQDACIVPDTSREGDLVVLLEGATLPAVLRLAPPFRHDQASEDYSLVGPLISERSIQHDCFRRNHVRNTLSSHYQHYKVEPLVQNLPTSRYNII